MDGQQQRHEDPHVSSGVNESAGGGEESGDAAPGMGRASARSGDNDQAMELSSSPSVRASSQGGKVLSRGKKAPADGSSGRKRRRKKKSSPQERRNRYQAEDPVLATLLDRLRLYFYQENPAAGDEGSDVSIDVRMARYLLEASSGNIELAASLYCEEFLASEGGREDASSNQPSAANDSDDAVAGHADQRWRHAGDNETGSSDADSEDSGARRAGREEERRVRRRLDDQFAAWGGPNADRPEQGPNDGEHRNEEEGVQAPEANAVARAEVAEVAPEEDHGESVSVSDDETGVVCVSSVNRWRRVGSVAGPSEDEDEERAREDRVRWRRRPPIDRNIRRAAQQPLNGERVRRFVSDNAANNDSDDADVVEAASAGDNSLHESAESEMDNDADGLSEDDLSVDDEISQVQGAPSELLWGLGSSMDGSNSNAREETRGANPNVVAEDSSSAADVSTGVPSTWLNAGFSLSSCGKGLALKPPQGDSTLLRWRQQNQREGRSARLSPFAPYHCQGITAILSAVTALMYSGASIQGTRVTCSSSRKPFAELSEKDRVREFDSRLTDALSVLLHVAAMASVSRKRKAHERRGGVRGDGEDCDKMKDQMIERRLRLCTTCRWDDETVTSEGRPPEGEDAGKHVRISTSLSSIHDIRSYVLSNIRSFTGRGGVALFLETLLRIHGKKCVQSMVRRARRKAGLPETVKSLVACDCQERWRRESTSANTFGGNVRDGTCLGLNCVGNELLSLLLTGQVFSALKGWTTGSLEVGLLSDERGEVGRVLTRPEKNVWILRGETCYSVMWLNGCKDSTRSNASLDKPGRAFQLSHWNCWYGRRNLSGMRVNTARGEWHPPTQKKLSFAAETSKKTGARSIFSRSRQQRANVVSADEHDRDGDNEGPLVTKDEIERVRFHPDDARYYPEQYRRWRFDMATPPETAEGASGGNGCGKANELGAPSGGERGRQENWIPYFRLNSRQRLVVEMKLAPKINRILWTRWPGATIDNFSPVDGPPPIV